MSGVRSVPSVGVLLSTTTLARVPTDAGGRYLEMAQEGLAANLIPVFFDLESVDLTNDLVTGWVWGGAEWQRSTGPVPEVIYSRATFPELSRRADAQQVLRRLTCRKDRLLLNSVNSFSKRAVHDALQFFRETLELTPETEPLSDPGILEGMVGRFGAAYVKLDGGSHGSDVLRVHRSSGLFRVLGRARGRPVDELFSEVGDLAAFVKLVGPSGEWVVQQAIDLPKVEDRIFDLRAIVQKDGEGQWTVPLVLVRVAPQGAVAANMSLGAEACRPDTFLSLYGSRFPELADMEAKAVHAAIRTAWALESRFGALGEIGIDLGLDRSGRPWVLEANTKPLHPRVEGLELSLVRGPIRYAAHLAARLKQGRESGFGSGPGDSN